MNDIFKVFFYIIGGCLCMSYLCGLGKDSSLTHGMLFIILANVI